MDDLTANFIAFSRQKLMEEIRPRLSGCLEELTPDQIWWRPNEESNSIGNLLLHLNGNVRQWILSGLGGMSDSRKRDAEFTQMNGISTGELIGVLSGTLDEVDKLLRRLTTQDLLRKYTIQGFQVTGLEAVYHVVEHFAMHYGQILYVVKMLQNQDLGFYAHLSGSETPKV